MLVLPCVLGMTMATKMPSRMRQPPTTRNGSLKPPNCGICTAEALTRYLIEGATRHWTHHQTHTRHRFHQALLAAILNSAYKMATYEYHRNVVSEFGDQNGEGGDVVGGGAQACKALRMSFLKNRTFEDADGDTERHERRGVLNFFREAKSRIQKIERENSHPKRTVQTPAATTPET